MDGHNEKQPEKKNPPKDYLPVGKYELVLFIIFVLLSIVTIITVISKRVDKTDAELSLKNYTEYLESVSISDSYALANTVLGGKMYVKTKEYYKIRDFRMTVRIFQTNFNAEYFCTFDDQYYFKCDMLDKSETEEFAYRGRLNQSLGLVSTDSNFKRPDFSFGYEIILIEGRVEYVKP